MKRKHAIGERWVGVRQLAGFSLTELLVTILVAAVFFMMALSGVQVVMERARSSKCVSNLRQIGAVILLYTNDHRGDMPPATLNSGAVIWYRELYPYLGISSIAAGQSIFACPSKKADEGTGHSYAIDYNATLGATSTPPPIKFNSLLSKDATTGERWLVIDSSWYFIRATVGSAYPATATRLRHSGRANVLLPDNSVISLTRDEINSRLYLYKNYPIPAPQG